MDVVIILLSSTATTTDHTPMSSALKRINICPLFHLSCFNHAVKLHGVCLTMSLLNSYPQLMQAMQMLKPDAWIHLLTFWSHYNHSFSCSHFLPHIFQEPQSALLCRGPRSNHYFALTESLQLNVTEFLWVLTELRWFCVEVCITTRQLAIVEKKTDKNTVHTSSD